MKIYLNPSIIKRKINIIDRNKQTPCDNGNKTNNINYFNYSPNFTNTLAFKGFSCAPSSFQVKELKNLRCPVCGLIMLDNNQINAFINDVSPKKGEALAKALEKYEDETYITGRVKEKDQKEKKGIYRAQKKEIVNIIKKLAIENPTLDLAELVQHQAKVYLNNLIALQLNVISELENYIIENITSLDELSAIKNIIEKYRKQILGQSEEEFARKKFIYALVNVIEDKEKQQEINKIVSKLPNSSNDINSFFVKYSKGYSSKEIAKRFVIETIPTTEHLVPQSTGKNNGYNILFINSSSNYICDCSECNTKRGTTPFSEWMETIPDFSQNLQDYINEVQAALDKGLLDEKYSEYITDIIKKINKLSNGQIVLIDPNFVNGSLKETEIISRAKLLDAIREKLNALTQKKNELYEEITSLEAHPQFKRIIQHQTLTERVDKIETRLSQLGKENNPDNQDEINSLEQEHKKLKNTIRILEIVIPSTDKIKGQIKEKQGIIKQVEDIDFKISKLRNSISDKISITERMRLLQIEKARIISELQALGDNENPNESNNVARYNYLLEMTQRSAEIFEKIEAEQTINEKIDKDILTIAQIAIQKQIQELLKDNDVKRYQDNKTIQQIAQEEEKEKARIKEIEEIEEEINSLITQIETLTKGTTITDMQNDVIMLQDELTQVEKIKNIQKLRSEFEAMLDLINYNNMLLNELKVYKRLSREEFDNLIGQFYLK